MSASDAADPHLRLAPPTVADGAALWRLARATGVLDVNAPYAYLLWCRDFAATSVVARFGDDGGGDPDRNDDGPVVGFVTGYVRPDDPEVLMIWQVAVDEAARGHGIAGAMLDYVFAATGTARPGVRVLETTITDDNAASRRLFTAFAERHGAPLERLPLFDERLFPAGSGETHAAEILHRIGPVGGGPGR